MKSAYELAMERLEKASGPSKKLSDEQRERIAEIDKIYDAKIAEAKLGFEGKLGSATSIEELENLKQEQTQALAALETEREAKKEAVWNEA